MKIKIFSVLFLLPALAFGEGVCQLTGYENRFTSELESLFKTQIEKLTDIEVDTSTIDVNVSMGPLDNLQRITTRIEGSFKSTKGTQFLVMFSAVPYDLDKASWKPEKQTYWQPVLSSRGFDKEGNAIDGHCDMLPGWEGKGVGTFVNAKTMVRVGEFRINKVRLY